jgi:hypothetical protein
LVSGLVLMAGVAVATYAAAATVGYRQQPFIARRSDALRACPAVRKDSESVRQPYPPRFYSDVSRGIQGCRWLMERAIETNPQLAATLPRVRAIGVHHGVTLLRRRAPLAEEVARSTGMMLGVPIRMWTSRA